MRRIISLRTMAQSCATAVRLRSALALKQVTGCSGEFGYRDVSVKLDWDRDGCAFGTPAWLRALEFNGIAEIESGNIKAALAGMPRSNIAVAHSLQSSHSRQGFDFETKHELEERRRRRRRSEQGQK